MSLSVKLLRQHGSGHPQGCRRLVSSLLVAVLSSPSNFRKTDSCLIHSQYAGRMGLWLEGFAFEKESPENREARL